MSGLLDSAQAQWLEQLEAMRKAIAELNLPADAERLPAYGDDLELDDDLSGTASGDDIWDVVSIGYEDDGYSSDQLDPDDEGRSSAGLYDQKWLAERCADVARRGSGLDAGALKEQVAAILASDSNGE